MSTNNTRGLSYLELLLVGAFVGSIFIMLARSVGSMVQAEATISHKAKQEAELAMIVGSILKIGRLGEPCTRNSLPSEIEPYIRCRILVHNDRDVRFILKNVSADGHSAVPHKHFERQQWNFGSWTTQFVNHEIDEFVICSDQAGFDMRDPANVCSIPTDPINPFMPARMTTSYLNLVPPQSPGRFFRFRLRAVSQSVYAGGFQTVIQSAFYGRNPGPYGQSYLPGSQP